MSSFEGVRLFNYWRCLRTALKALLPFDGLIERSRILNGASLIGAVDGNR